MWQAAASRVLKKRERHGRGKGMQRKGKGMKKKGDGNGEKRKKGKMKRSKWVNIIKVHIRTDKNNGGEKKDSRELAR